MMLDGKAAIASLLVHLGAAGGWAAYRPLERTPCLCILSDPEAPYVVEIPSTRPVSVLEVRMPLVQAATDDVRQPTPPRSCAAATRVDEAPILPPIRLEARTDGFELPGFCADVDASGRVMGLQVLTRAPGWRKIAEHLRTTRLTPARLDGHAVAVRVTVTFVSAPTVPAGA